MIVEKPAFSTPSEMAEIIELANENQVLFFEAARNIHEKSFDTIASVLTEHGNTHWCKLYLYEILFTV